MPPDADDAAHLWDMVQAAQAIETYIARLRLEHYLGDRQLRSAARDMAAPRRRRGLGHATRPRKGTRLGHPR
ncbi:MAG: hypothetical protein V2A79_09195 [Planctomycetota bacterium]